MYLTQYKEDRFVNFYKGMFKGVHCINKNLIFIDVVETKRYPDEIGHRGWTELIRNDLLFVPNDTYTFHNIDQVKENKKKAIQNMEKRSLDLILKRLINEQFEW